ncbi:MAG: hypothetical protein CMJ40_10645 [Phycisphaerae bacterium]|nr:hypothetical protein [Phycisphaerae bacterium]|tara:strand:- start:719 stop:1687 length:969 start_codon:yes stop_codon:yes gene_type:complete
MSFGQILFAIGLPAMVGAILIVPAWLVPRIRRLSGLTGSALGVALGMALVVAFMAEAGIPSLPPDQKWHMLPILTCGIVILCPVVAIVDGSGEMGRWLISIASGGIIGWFAVFPGLDLLGQILLGVWVGISFMVISWVSHRRRGVTVTLSITLVFAALSILCMQAHFITLTLIAGALSATSGIGFVTAFISERWGPEVPVGSPVFPEDESELPSRSLAIGWGGAFAVASIIPLVAFCGWAYNVGDVTWLHWGLVAGAPLMLGIGELPGLHHREGFWWFLVRVGLVALPIVLALTLFFTGAGLGADSDTGGDGIDYMHYMDQS